MFDFLFQISPELVNSSSKICSIMAFNDTYLVFVVDSTSIKVVDYNGHESFANAVINSPHQGADVKCVRLSHADLSPTRLMSCGANDVRMWTLSELFMTSRCTARRIGEPGWFAFEIDECAFHANNRIVGVSCRNGSIIVIDAETNQKLDEIALNLCLNRFEFSLFHSNLLFISVETGLVVSYDFRKRETMQELHDDDFKSSFVDICGLENEPLLLLGTSNGQLHLYQYINGRFLNLKKIELKTFGFEETTPPVCIGLDLFSSGLDTQTDSKVIACASLNRIYLIDLYSGNLINSFKHVNFSNGGGGGGDDKTCIPQRVDFCLSKQNEILASLLYVFKNEINVVKLIDMKPLNDNRESETVTIKPVQSNDILTVFPKLSLLENSPLNEDLKQSQDKKSKILSVQEYLRNKSTSSLKKSESQSLDKPITFNSRIRSSGYNLATVKRERFQPMINQSSKSLSLNKLDIDKKPKTSKTSPLRSKNEEFKFHLPTNLKNKFAATDRSSPIIDLKFSSDGHNIAFVSNDNLIQLTAAANPEKSGLCFSSHVDTVNSIDISHNGKYLISASQDKSCKLWSLNSTSGKSLVMDIKSIESKKEKRLAVDFKKKEPTCAQFFYLDKFILIGCDKNLLVCNYHVDTSRNDIQRYANNSTCQLVTEMPMTFSQQSISCLAAINSFYSYLVLCAGSNKDIEVFDLNEAKSCLTIHEAHSRPLVQLVQNTSEYNRLSYDVFASSSVCDGVKLWDLRASSSSSSMCVGRLDAHLNRYLATRCSFSPDSFYMAVASEDRTALVYDLRMMGQVVKKYSGHFSDCVSCAVFNPKRTSQLMCATLDGKLINYQD